MNPYQRKLGSIFTTDYEPETTSYAKLTSTDYDPIHESTFCPPLASTLVPNTVTCVNKIKFCVLQWAL